MNEGRPGGRSHGTNGREPPPPLLDAGRGLHVAPSKACPIGVRESKTGEAGTSFLAIGVRTATVCALTGCDSREAFARFVEDRAADDNAADAEGREIAERNEGKAVVARELAAARAAKLAARREFGVLTLTETKLAFERAGVVGVFLLRAMKNLQI